MINDGHVYAPKELLAQRAIELLAIPQELIAPALERLAQDERIRPEMIPLNSKNAGKGTQSVSESQAMYGTPVIYLTPLYFGEKGVAERLLILAGATSQEKMMNHSLFSVENLSEEQQDAVNMALTHPLSILTGGPGTGKTTCLRALITIIADQHKRFALASPTERAAKRFSEARDIQPAPFTVYWNILQLRASNTTMKIRSIWTFWLWTKPRCWICADESSAYGRASRHACIVCWGYRSTSIGGSWRCAAQHDQQWSGADHPLEYYFSSGR
jgi:hypothetical protein